MKETKMKMAMIWWWMDQNPKQEWKIIHIQNKTSVVRTTSSTCWCQTLNNVLRNQVLGSNAWSLDGSSDERGPSQPNPPGGSNHGQSKAKGDAKTSISIGRHVSQDFWPSLITVFWCTLRRAHDLLLCVYWKVLARERWSQSIVDRCLALASC